MLQRTTESQLQKEYNNLPEKFKIGENIPITSNAGITGERSILEVHDDMRGWLLQKSKTFESVIQYSPDSLIAVINRKKKEGLFLQDLKDAGILDTTICDNVLKFCRASNSNVSLTVLNNNIDSELKEVKGIYIPFVDISGLHFKKNRDKILKYWIYFLNAKQV